jgi:hypothetical protein
MKLIEQLAIGVCLLATAIQAEAATCVVDASGLIPGSYPDINAALAPSACGSAGSTIHVYCPAAGCTYGSTRVLGRNKINIRSMEVTGSGGPVTINQTLFPWAVQIRKSTGIVFEGIHAYRSNVTGILVQDSDASIVGLIRPFPPRYSRVEAYTGIEVTGDSGVGLSAVGVASNHTAMRIASRGSRHPVVFAEAIALLDNEIAVEMDGGGVTCPAGGGPTLDLRGDFGAAWLNYVMGNVEGFLLHGSSRLRIDHTVLAGNLRTLPGYRAVPLLFELQDASRLEGRNLLAYDNDGYPNPGTPTPWSACTAACTNTPGAILHHETCDEAVLEASTFSDNQNDLIFHLAYALGAGSGLLTLDHVIVADSWGKVLSQSSFFTTSSGCASVSATGSSFWDNSVDSDPAPCMPGSGIDTTWNPAFSYSTFPVTLTGYPVIPAPFAALYLMAAPNEPIVPYPQPPNLYLGRDWTVDGVTPDADQALDMGYHNPK